MLIQSKQFKHYISISVILLAAFAARIINLNGLPIFTDEAIYIRWTQIANGDPNWRFISLTDGKQPLFVWLNMVSQRIISDPLFAGRFVSVIAGVLTCLGLYFLGREIFSKKVGLWASAIWAIFPFALWHDRLALMDSWLAFFTVLAMYLQIKLVRKQQTDTALILGIVMGLGLLTKSSAQFFIYLLPFSLLLAVNKLTRIQILRWLGLAAVAGVFAELINSVQRLSPFFYIVGQKNLTFLYSFRELMGFSLFQHWQRFWGNLYSLGNWSITYITVPLLLCLIFSIWKLRTKWQEKSLLIIWFLVPFVALSFFGKVIYPRFVLFMMVPLVILIADSINRLQKIFIPLIFLILLYPLYFDSQIIFNQINAPLPWADRGQYIDDWPAGWGINQVVSFLDKQSQNAKITIGTEGTFGLTPFSLEIYLNKNKNIEIIGYWPISDGIAKLHEIAKEKPTYLLLKDTQTPDPAWKVELVSRYKRGNGNNYLGLYRVLTP